MLEPTHWWTEQLHAFTHSALLLILPLCLLVSHTVLVLCDIKHRGWIWKPSCLHIMPAKIVQLCRRGGGGVYGGAPPYGLWGRLSFSRARYLQSLVQDSKAVTAQHNESHLTLANCRPPGRQDCFGLLPDKNFTGFPATSNWVAHPMHCHILLGCPPLHCHILLGSPPLRPPPRTSASDHWGNVTRSQGDISSGHQQHGGNEWNHNGGGGALSKSQTPQSVESVCMGGEGFN